MKFRILDYLGKYKPQVGISNWKGYTWETQWTNIGLPEGYESVEEAKSVCEAFKI